MDAPKSKPPLYFHVINLIITSYVLVTGSTGFIGAHVVDSLLKRGLKVRGATRSLQKGEQMKAARPEYASKLDFVQVEDFTNVGVFDNIVQDVDAVIHVASVCIQCLIITTIPVARRLNHLTKSLIAVHLQRYQQRERASHSGHQWHKVYSFCLSSGEHQGSTRSYNLFLRLRGRRQQAHRP